VSNADSTPLRSESAPGIFPEYAAELLPAGTRVRAAVRLVLCESCLTHVPVGSLFSHVMACRS